MQFGWYARLIIKYIKKLESVEYHKFVNGLKSCLGQKASLKSRIRHTWAIQAKQALNTCGTGQLMHAKNVAATFWHFSRSILMDLRKPLFKPRPAWSWSATKYHNVLFPQYNINVISNVQLCRLEMAPLLNKLKQTLLKWGLFDRAKPNFKL